MRRDGYHQLSFGTLAEAVTHRARAGYYGLMTQIDHQLMRVFEALAEFGLADDTIIAFTSDHGEMMGDHDFYRKGVGYEGSARVPFIVAPAPRDRQALRGAVVDEVVELRDIMTTLLELAGVPVPETCDGKSLLRLWKGRIIADLTGREEGFVCHGELVTGAPVVTMLGHARTLANS